MYIPVWRHFAEVMSSGGAQIELDRIAKLAKLGLGQTWGAGDSVANTIGLKQA